VKPAGCLRERLNSRAVPPENRPVPQKVYRRPVCILAAGAALVCRIFPGRPTCVVKMRSALCWMFILFGPGAPSIIRQFNVIVQLTSDFRHRNIATSKSDAELISLWRVLTLYNSRHCSAGERAKPVEQVEEVFHCGAQPVRFPLRIRTTVRAASRLSFAAAKSRGMFPRVVNFCRCRS